MENKISMAELAAMVALATGKQKDLCDKFLRELFLIVEEELKKGENVRIKGFGTFKLVEVEPRKSVNVATGEENEIPGHNKVIFVMAKELASLVNAPFDAFEAVEIADGLATDLLEGETEVTEIVSIEDESWEDKSETVVREAKESEIKGESNVGEAILTEKNTNADNKASKIEESATAEQPESEVEGPIIPQDGDRPVVSTVYNNLEDNLSEGKNRSVWKRYKFIIGFIAGVCAAILIGWIIISVGHSSKSDEKQDEIVVVEDLVEAGGKPQDYNQGLSDTVSQEASSVIKDSIPGMAKEEVATRPSDTPVYDTVTTTRYLTTIAQDHYGNFNLWPIIYEANATILGHPNRISPGTKVVVPSLKNYNIDPDKPEDIEAMKQRGNAIYRNFK